MLVGRDKEIGKLILNLERGIHTVVFGAEGVGKSALLQELAARPSKTRPIYVRDCGSRRALLEGALRCMTAAQQVASAPLRESLIKDLRDRLVKVGRQRNSCLMLDHLPRLRHRMQHLLEILEQYFTLICAVRSSPGAYDLYYWKFERLEVGNLSAAAAIFWIERELAKMGCKGSLGRAVADEVQRLCRGNPGLISDTLNVMQDGAVPLDDPIRVRRLFIDGRLSHLKIRHTFWHE
jgi:hypothetical protein